MISRLPALFLLLCQSLSFAQNPVPAVSANPEDVVSFTFDWPEAEVPHWSIRLSQGPDGTLIGRYDRFDAGATPPAETRHPLTVSSVTSQHLLDGFKTVVVGNCETRNKHLARTGQKSIAYARPGSDTWASCTFNYSDDKALMDAATAFQAIAETIQTGERLEHTHRFDRLGLDAQLDFLTSEAKDGRAIELQNIAPVLRSIIDDDHVIDRARRKAARLLQDAAPAPATAESSSPL